MRYIRFFAIVTVAGASASLAAACGSSGTADDLVHPLPPDAAPDAPAALPDAAGMLDTSFVDSAKDSAVGSALCGTNGTNMCAGNEKCSPTLGCVGCLSSADCAGGTRPFCIAGSCEACRSNADCGLSAPACFPGDHRCHPACVAGTCPGDAPTCDAVTGQCIGCTTSADCTVGDRKACDPTTRQCVACVLSAQCPAARPECHPTRLECVACLSNTSCPASRPVCSAAADFTCVATCTKDGQCLAPTPKCDTSTASCVQCLTKPDCAGTPKTPLCTAQNRCVECIVKADCSADAGAPLCGEGKCVACIDDPDCPLALPKCNNGTCKVN